MSDQIQKTAKVISHSLKIGMLILAVIAWNVRGTSNSLTIILSFFFVVYFNYFFHQKKINNAWKLDLLVTFSVFLSAMGFAYLFDHHLWQWWDSVTHFVLPFIFGLVIFYLIFKEKIFGEIKASRLLVGIFIFSIAMSLSVVWEILEFFVDYFFEPIIKLQSDPMQNSLYDTMNDLAMGLAGAVAITFWVIYAFFKKDNRK